MTEFFDLPAEGSKCFFKYSNVDKRSNFLNNKLQSGFKTWCIEQLYRLYHHSSGSKSNEETKTMALKPCWHKWQLAVSSILYKKTYFPNDNGC